LNSDEIVPCDRPPERMPPVDFGSHLFHVILIKKGEKYCRKALIGSAVSTVQVFNLIADQFQKHITVMLLFSMLSFSFYI